MTLNTQKIETLSLCHYDKTATKTFGDESLTFCLTCGNECELVELPMDYDEASND